MSINDYRDPDWVAEKFGLDKNTVYKFLQDGTIPAIQLGRKWLISEAELGQRLDAQTREQTQARRQAACSVERTVHRMDNFSAEARQALKSAHSEARRYAHRYLGQGHLLLAMVAQADSRPRPACSGRPGWTSTSCAGPWRPASRPDKAPFRGGSPANPPPRRPCGPPNGKPSPRAFPWARANCCWGSSAAGMDRDTKFSPPPA